MFIVYYCRVEENIYFPSFLFLYAGIEISERGDRLTSATMSYFTPKQMAKARTIFSTVASVAGAAMVFRLYIKDMEEVHNYFISRSESLYNRFSSEITMVFDELNGYETNQLYQAIEIYLSSLTDPKTKRFNLKKSDKEKNITVTVARDREIIDSFEGAQFKWFVLCQKQYNPLTPGFQKSLGQRSEQRSFQVSFHKKHKDKVVASYLPFILEAANFIKQQTKTLKIFTLDDDRIYGNGKSWSPAKFDHPATFDTLAMDPKIKKMIMDDLDTFLKRKDFYKKVGKAWKRGYLFYGPPGTGKSSLIAAMANYLKFDVYDLELSSLTRNSELRKLMFSTTNRSMLVVEDIDCNIQVKDRLAKASPSSYPDQKKQPQVTLSGLLNFIDGLWSSCGDGRIIVFTTNHKDRLDPALLRPGRMDLHINLSYCTPCGFRLFASNYLKVEDHELFKTIEKMIQDVEVSPAEVAEQLLSSGGGEVILQGLIEFMRTKKKEKEEAQAKKVEDESKEKSAQSKG